MNYLNKIILFISLISFNLFFAQVGIGTTSPDPSSLLDVESNSKGILIPRMIELDRLAIVPAANGLLVYQTNGTFPGFYYYDDTITDWQLLPNNLESVKGVNTNLVLNGTDLEVTDGKGTITADLSSLKELPTPVALGAMNYWDGAAWVEVAPTPNEGATLKMIGGVPTWDGGISPPPAIGNPYQGGLLFYIYQTGDDGYVAGEVHGLIAATSDQSPGLAWITGGNTQNTENGNTLLEIGKGQANTTAMMNQFDYTGGAAQVCDDYSVTVGGITYSDWFLPSKDELNLMYQNIGNGDVLGLGNIGGFSNSFYWSSSESSSSIANSWRQNFDDGAQNEFYKGNTEFNVRAVRAF
jgi:hypothetical protein